MVFSRRYEATPVPVRGSGVRPSELRSLVYEERRVGIPRPPPLMIDLTERDDNDVDECEPQVQDSTEPFFTSQFADLVIRPRAQPNSGPPSAIAPQQTTRRVEPSFSQPDDARWNKRKESEPYEAEDANGTWPSKRRLRLRKAVIYTENGAGDDKIDLGEPLENLIPSIEKDHDENDSDGEDFEVERVIAQRTGRRTHEYLLGWVGYTELSWISAQHCKCDELIAQFQNVPRFDVPAESSAAREFIEEERVRWLERAVGQRGYIPARAARPRGMGSARNPKTGRFERKSVKKNPRTLYRVIRDSEDEDEENFWENRNDVLRHEENVANRTPSKTPTTCCKMRRESLPRQFIARSTPQTEMHGHDQAQDVISIRQTPLVEDASPRRPTHWPQENQPTKQTAKVFLTRKTPDTEGKQTSFFAMHSNATDLRASIERETVQYSQKSRTELTQWSVVSSKSARASLLGSENTSAPAAVNLESTELSPATVIEALDSQVAITKSRLEFGHSSSLGMPRAHQTPSAMRSSSFTAKKKDLSASVSMTSVRDVGLKPSNSLLALNTAATSLFGLSLASQSSRNPWDVPYSFGPKSNPTDSSPTIKTRRANVESTWWSINKSSQVNALLTLQLKQNSALDYKGVNPAPPQKNSNRIAQTSPDREPGTTPASEKSSVAISQPAMSEMGRATQPPSTSSAGLPRAISPRLLSSVKVSRPILLSLSPPNSPESSIGAKRSSAEMMTKVAQPTTQRPPRSIQSPSKACLVRDTSTRLPSSALAFEILQPLAAGTARTLQSTASIPSASFAHTGLDIRAARVTLSAESETAHKVYDAERRRFTDLSWTETNQLQQKVVNIHNSPQDPVKEVKDNQRFALDGGKKLNGKQQSSETAAAKILVLKDRWKAGSRRSTMSPQRKKRARELRKATTAIEDEIASDPGPHCMSKSIVAATLSSASMKAPRRLHVVQQMPPGKSHRYRSPSLATTAFQKAREREKASKRAPSAVRREVNGDLGHYYPIGLCMVAKELEATDIHRGHPGTPLEAPYRRCSSKTYGFNMSDDTPRPSIEK
jgi:hypothetical protein